MCGIDPFFTRALADLEQSDDCFPVDACDLLYLVLIGLVLQLQNNLQQGND